MAIDAGAEASCPSRSPRLGALLLLAAALGCTSPTGTVCTEEAISGLSVRVRDSVTGLPAGAGATVIATDGSYQETLTYAGAFSPADFFGAFERAGRYRIDVTRAGYLPWTRANVVVVQGVCHIVPTGVDARLQPIP